MTDMQIVDIEPTVTPDAPDWSVLELDGVTQVAEKAARKIASDYAHTIEFEDALQEAYVFLATKAFMVRSCVAAPELGLGVLHSRIYRGLRDVVKTEARRRSKHVSYDVLVEGAE